MATIFLRGLCGHAWVKILNLSPPWCIHWCEIIHMNSPSQFTFCTIPNTASALRLSANSEMNGDELRLDKELLVVEWQIVLQLAVVGDEDTFSFLSYWGWPAPPKIYKSKMCMCVSVSLCIMHHAKHCMWQGHAKHSVNSWSASRDNWCTVGGDGGCRVGEVWAGATSPMPDHMGFKLQ